MGIYGPRTVFCIALKDAPGCHEFLLQVRQARL
jgi:sedoheptulose-bisphosphatase